MTALTRIAESLLPLMDKLIEVCPKDEFGIPKYKSRVDVVNDAVKELLKKYDVKMKEASP